MKEEMGTSPLPPQQVPQQQQTEVKTKKPPLVMDFFTALREILAGKKITRLEWESEAEYGYLKDGFLNINHKNDDKLHGWHLHESDINAEDWAVIE